ncbi:MAG: inositol phosphorylceramide synthase [Solirubrobacteraceae bacterium]|nr:inositol phosphorylceramide synthase [Solirubrobacteraceae bacterium]
MWPTWSDAAIAAALSAGLWLALRRWPHRPWAVQAADAAKEFTLIAVLYGIWRIARKLPLATEHGAIERAHQIADLQATLRLPNELAIERWVASHDVVASASVWYYATVHVPALIAFLVWLFWRHREQFPHWRNGLALVTLGCLIIRFVRVAPPRLLPDLGYWDLAQGFGASLYGADVTTGVSDQFAAMPSIHVAWAAVVSFGIVATSTSRWRWLFLLHVVATMFVVVATGNHWWLDGIVALALLWAGLWLDSAVRRRRRSASAQLDRVVPAGAGEVGLEPVLDEPAERPLDVTP